MGWVRQAILAVCCASAISSAAHAQGLSSGTIQSPVLVLDQEQLFIQSGLTERLSSELEAARQQLSEENRRIEAELEAEEIALTERRDALSAEEFSVLADAFDTKVQALRAEQEAKIQALQQRNELDRQDFLRQIQPILAEIVRERGGLIVIDRRAVIIPAEAIDITDEAVARIKAALDTAPTPPAPVNE